MTLNPATVIITGGFALYFLVSGGRALVRRRIQVVNPASRGAWPGLLGGQMWSQLPPNPLDPSPAASVEVTGAQAVRRAWLHLVMGAFFLGLGVFSTLVENCVL